MTLVNFPGGLHVPFGPSILPAVGGPAYTTSTIDAAVEAGIMTGHIMTSDGAPHTIDTSGPSSIQWRSGAVTFADAGTTVKVGLAAVDTANGPTPRAVNVADVITFDVSRTMVGGGGGITANAWQDHVPDAGSKTIANGDFVALGIQMTARGGADTIAILSTDSAVVPNHGAMNTFAGGVYASSIGTPIAAIEFADGAIGWFYGTDVRPVVTGRTFNVNSSPDEVGQLFDDLPPIRIAGIYGWVDPDANLEIILYSDPLGSPVAERTVVIDANTVSSATNRRIYVPFPSPYDHLSGPIVVAYRPTTTSNITLSYKTLANAAHRVADIWGTSGYGVTRTGTGAAFADANSGLDHYFIGLLLGGSDDGAGGGGGLAAPLFGGGVI